MGESMAERTSLAQGLRLTLRSLAILLLTLSLLPGQWLALRLDVRLARKLPRIYHRLVLRVIGLRIREFGSPTRLGPVLVAANHSSWLDICVIASRLEAAFVARADMRRWPGVGLLAALARSVFVDRSRRADVAKAAAAIAERMIAGETIVLFPEGTTSDGNRVLPFKPSLIHAARHLADAGRPLRVQPLAIAYLASNGLPLGRAARPGLCWYGDMTLSPHLAGVLRLASIDVALVWCAPVEIAATADRKVVAGQLEETVRAALGDLLSGRRRGNAVLPAE
jgi:1-acyl-sn-glycerol-3-phosphate acyltransferase